MRLLLMQRMLVFFILMLTGCTTVANDIQLVKGGKSDYSLLLSQSPSLNEKRAAAIIQDYVQRVSGAKLPIVNESAGFAGKAIYIGSTLKSGKASVKKVKAEGFLIFTSGQDLFITAGSGKGIVYGAYTFIEQYLGCLKLSNEAAFVPQNKDINLPPEILLTQGPDFIYRQAYYPASNDVEYLEWHKLQKFEDLWGLWGHSFNKLVPSKTYFKTHPEYYSLVGSTRQPIQLCLSNEDVFNIVVKEFKTRIADNPDALYWSISPNDDNGYCTCDKCKALDAREGGPSGSLINFANRVASKFPDKNFITLAYGYSHKPPKTIKPADNVFIFLSSIDAYRHKPLSEEGSAAGFRADLKGWGALTSNIFVWDYTTQFTNYMAPFPDHHTLQPNIAYFKANNVNGVFAQGCGDTYGEGAELKSYLLAKLLWNSNTDVAAETDKFLKAYYGKAADHIKQYNQQLQAQMLQSKKRLDIYGNPINEWNSYLTPELIDQYSSIFDKAEAAIEGNNMYLERVRRARLPVEYTVLQQTRFYGIEKHGIFEKLDNGAYKVKEKLPTRVAQFATACTKAGVTELSEGGLSPEQYVTEWNTIFKMGVTSTIALGSTVTLQHPFAEDFPAKGPKTLVDGNPGYNDFSYNWLCFYGTPMVATVDMGKVQTVNKVITHFLDDPRHWIFLPKSIRIETSADGDKYTDAANITVSAAAYEEHYELNRQRYEVKIPAAKVRYIRITAQNRDALPNWRNSNPNKKPMIACDEVYVQ